MCSCWLKEFFYRFLKHIIGLCSLQRTTLSNSANKRGKQATLRPMVFRQLATDAHAPVTNFKHCGSDWLLHKLLTSIVWTVAMVPPVLVITSVRAGAPTHTFISYCYNLFNAQGQSLLVLQTFNLASSDSNLGEVYIIGFLKVCSLLWCKAIRAAASKKLKQHDDE